MKKKGSVTTFFSLFMAVFLILVQAVFHSVQIAGGRVQAESGVEEGLYSVFAGFDRELFERYHVFFLDGGYGTGILQPGAMYQVVEESLMKSCFPGKKLTGIRGENLWKCSKESGAITGYTLAADQCGQAFKIQAVDYMKETGAIQGIQLLLEKSKSQEEIVKKQQNEGTMNQAKEAQKSYEEAKKQAEQQSEQEKQEPVQESVTVPPDFVNPLEVIKQLKDRGILSLVMPYSTQISQGSLGATVPLEKRNCQTGMGTLHYGEDPDTVWNNLIFQEYMMKYLDCYGEQKIPDDPSGKRLSYQLEYAIAGKKTDMENMKSVATRLLAIREASNMGYLLKDPASQAQIHNMALIICAAVGLPALEGVVSVLLTAAWAFGESLLDIRQLFQGGNIPLIKTAGSWNLSLANLSKLPQLFQQKEQTRTEGLSYREYLRILLSMGNKEEHVLRTMDMVEQTMQIAEGKQNFQMDLCVSYLQVEMEVSCAGQCFFIQRDYGYEM